MNIHELETPVPVVDLDMFERDLYKLQNYLSQHNIANRPHIKTHKSTAIAKMQMDAGAVGVTCQKLGEAEVMADAGISDIFLPYNLLGEAKLARLTELMQRATVCVTADSIDTVRGLGTAAKRAGKPLKVLVEFDCGMGRCGVQTPAEAATLAREIARDDNLIFGGLMTYPNRDTLDPFAQQTRALLKVDGIAVEAVSGGGTACMWQAHTHPELTEHRAGMYIFGDRGTMLAGAMALEDISFRVLATVVSRPTSDRGILDSGSKTLSSDLLGLTGHGFIVEYPDAKIFGLSEEHGHVDFSACTKKPVIGERVTVIPNHVCPVVNLFDEIVQVRNGEAVGIWRVDARGKVK
jgi:D-serine deaminase-like pyridoxal phosphate-dependent protein